ncbi:MAG: hypothetical protein ASARMPRED_002362 [Alectoria sarmentosa]|nr:MAG: hypothetical protein ASARMPRED_002362 [Alectoria sarmentosa]
MSYNPVYEASRALPVEYIAKELEDFAAAGQDLSGRRFSRSPPRVPSAPSTEYEESESPSPNARLQEKESWELMNSTANAQFTTQIKDELGRIRVARDKDLLQHPLFDLEEAAEANVKYRWIQQGIWDERWASQPSKVWKHELEESPPPVRPSDSAKEGGVKKFGTQHKRKHSDLEEEYHETVRCAVDYQNRQSSRPCYQFLYQFCQEREWIKMGLGKQDQDQQTKLDTRAYQSLKSRWMRDGIWDEDWSFIPGTSWRHERPRKTLDPHETYRRDDARKAARMERAEGPRRWYSMAPAAPLMRINWPSRPPVFLEAAFEPFSPSALGQSSNVMPSLRDRSTSPTHWHTDFPGSMLGQEHDEPRTDSASGTPIVNPTNFNSKRKALQKQKVNTSQPCVAESRPVKKRTPANKEKNRPGVPAVRQKEIANNARASRPRRAAAIKAMRNIAKAT